MAGQIQLIPPGLLGMLQIKNDGKNPSSLGEQIAPVFNLTEWYAWQNFERHKAEAGSLILGQVGPRIIESAAVEPGVGLKTPQDEWWYVHNFTVMANVTTSLPPGDFVVMLPMCNVYKNSGAHIWILPHTPIPPTRQTMPAVNDTGYAIGTDRPFFMPPNSELMIYVIGVVAGVSITTRGDALITRLPM